MGNLSSMRHTNKSLNMIRDKRIFVNFYVNKCIIYKTSNLYICIKKHKYSKLKNKYLKLIREIFIKNVNSGDFFFSNGDYYIL